jgi:hypothetical protein
MEAKKVNGCKKSKWMQQKKEENACKAVLGFVLRSTNKTFKRYSL